MACDAQTLENLSATEQLAKLSDRSLWAVLSNLYGVTVGATAKTAQALAVTNGYFGLSDLELWQCFLAALCSGTCDATSLAVQTGLNKYDRWSQRDIFEAMVTAGCTSNCSATALESSMVSNGYDRLSEREVLATLVINACASGCTAKTLFATAVANGYDKFSFRELTKAIVYVICQNGGAGGGGGGGGFKFTIPTGFIVNSNSHGTVLLSNWFLPAPAGVTGAEVWKSTDGVNYTLFSTVAPPANNQNFAALAVGQFQWTKLRWTNGAGGFSDFTPAQEFSGQAMDWAARCFTNGAIIGNISQIKAVNDMWCSLVNGGVSSQILVLNPIAGIGDLQTTQIPLIQGASSAVWAQTGANNTNSTVNGFGPAGAAKLDSGFAPTSWASNANAGMSLYAFTGGSEAAYDLGSFDGGTNQATLRVNNTGNTVACMFASGNQLTVASPGAGFYSLNRVGATDFRIFFGNSTNAFAQLGSTLAGANGSLFAPTMYLGCLDNNGGTTLFTSHTLSCVVFHNGLTLAQATVLFNAVQAMRVALGGGFV